jgi:hypothetical protein
VEDCDFHAFLNATDSDDNTRTVYRRNLMNNAAFGSHGADTSAFGNRHFEIYDNRMVFNGYGDGTTFNMNWWLFARGGTFVVTGNTIDKIVSMDYGNKQDVHMAVENLGRDSGPDPCWGLNTTNGADYHAPRQIGYGYVTGTGRAPNGTGSANDPITYVGDSEPAYIWGNTVNNGPMNIGAGDYGNVSSDSCSVTRAGTPDLVAKYIVAGRDYVDGTAKPGYARFTYPHPLRPGAITGTGTVPFASFTARLEVHRSHRPSLHADESFEVEGRGVLGAASHGIAPETEDVTLSLGPFSLTIPAGSFVKKADKDDNDRERERGRDNDNDGKGKDKDRDRNKDRDNRDKDRDNDNERKADRDDLQIEYVFKGVIDGVSLKATIERQPTKELKFEFEGRGADLSHVGNPVKVGLAIGDDVGSVVVQAHID